MNALIEWLPTGANLPDEEFARRHRVVKLALQLHVPLLIAVGLVNGFDVLHVLADVAFVVVLLVVATVSKDRVVASMAAKWPPAEPPIAPICSASME